MAVPHRFEAVLIPLAGLALMSITIVVVPAGQVADKQGGSPTAEIQYVTTSAVRARDEAAETAKVTRKEQDDAVQIRAARKKELDAALTSGLMGPKVTPDELNQRRERYDAATRILTEKTLAATEAQKELRRRERDVQSLVPEPGTPPSAVPMVNPLVSVKPHLGPTYVHVAELNQILSDTRRLPPPLFGDPKFAAEPIEVQLKKIQSKYEHGTSGLPDVAQYPKPPSDVINAGPVTVAGTQWSNYHFNQGGELTVDTRGWPQWGAGTWTQTGNKVVMRWKAKGPYHGTYFFPEEWVEHTVTAQISGDTITGSMEDTWHTTGHGEAPSVKIETHRFTAKRKD